MRGPVSILLTLLLLAVPFVLSGGDDPPEKACCCDSGDGGTATAGEGCTKPPARKESDSTPIDTRSLALAALGVVLPIVTAAVLHLVLDHE